jgi:hypothetical protein
VSIFDWVELAAGTALVVVILYDLFQGVVLPRPAVGRGRLGPALVRNLWHAWRWLGTRPRLQARREALLAMFGPAMLLILLAGWASLLIIGYGLVLHAVRGQIGPHPPDLGGTFFLSALSLLTVEFGDMVPIGPAARVVVVLEAANGLGMVALVISLLFSLYGSFQRREVAVVTLDASAGAPPSCIHLLETCAKFEMPDQLKDLLKQWTDWAAEVLESHLAYPLLTYFRSSHDNEAWLNSFGVMMDTALLVTTTLEDGPKGQAHLMFRVGSHLVEDLSWYFRLGRSDEVGVEYEEFMQARAQLAVVGYRLREAGPAWQEFSSMRARYASPLNLLAHRLAIIPAQWIGDRSYLPHHDQVRK